MSEYMSMPKKRWPYVNSFPVVLPGTQLQSSLHVNRKPIPPNIKAAEQRHVLAVHHVLQADG
jgi:hypothetical protein